VRSPRLRPDARAAPRTFVPVSVRSAV